MVSNGSGGPMMKLSPKLKEQLHKPWANALILKNMGRSHTLNFMVTKLTRKWSLLGQWQLTDLGEGHSKESCREGVVDPIHEDNTCDMNANEGKEASPYGINGKMEGGHVEVRNGKKNNMKVGSPAKNMEGIASTVDSRASGSRKHETKGKYQAQLSLAQEIDCERQDSASVLRQFHKEVMDFETKCSAVADGSIMQDTLTKNAIYANPCVTSRKSLWNYLDSIRNCFLLPWLIVGDFNEITCHSVKRGGRYKFSNSGFANRIGRNNLVDMGFIGSRFTWMAKKGIGEEIWERLDKALCSMD
ncbi:hypothetical protein Dsin_009816 [Dipteronia sinensis]|uniref:Uncharacterized protein n=1 Tax=Dipteronia sinensis TaxID=43782 RepID=A0AAE0AR67_9ROSI|nr:hypothetical protein Dsin_009816 [Dipteronia sinensis]